MNSKGEELLLIRAGDIVGEIEVLEENRRQYFAATNTDVLLFMIKSSELQELLKLFPLVEKYLKKIIKKRIKKINNVELECTNKYN